MTIKQKEKMKYNLTKKSVIYNYNEVTFLRRYSLYGYKWVDTERDGIIREKETFNYSPDGYQDIAVLGNSFFVSDEIMECRYIYGKNTVDGFQKKRIGRLPRSFVRDIIKQTDKHNESISQTVARLISTDWFSHAFSIEEYQHKKDLWVHVRYGCNQIAVLPDDEYPLPLFPFHGTVVIVGNGLKYLQVLQETKEEMHKI